MNKNIITAYQRGEKLDNIAQDYSKSKNEVVSELLLYKESEFFKSQYSQDFQIFVSERVSLGYTKTEVAKELKLAQNTVAKFCKSHPQDDDLNDIEEKLYTHTDLEYVKGQCPECKSKHFNHVDWNSHYCMDCGNEYKIVANVVMKLNFEFL